MPWHEPEYRKRVVDLQVGGCMGPSFGFWAKKLSVPDQQFLGSYGKKSENKMKARVEKARAEAATSGTGIRIQPDAHNDKVPKSSCLPLCGRGTQPRPSRAPARGK
jgi:hypothetical protein